MENKCHDFYSLGKGRFTSSSLLQFIDKRNLKLMVSDIDREYSNQDCPIFTLPNEVIENILLSVNEVSTRLVCRLLRDIANISLPILITNLEKCRMIIRGEAHLLKPLSTNPLSPSYSSSTKADIIKFIVDKSDPTQLVFVKNFPNISFRRAVDTNNIDMVRNIVHQFDINRSTVLPYYKSLPLDSEIRIIISYMIDSQALLSGTSYEVCNLWDFDMWNKSYNIIE